MLEAEKWAAGKPKEFADLALQFAFSSQTICQIIRYFHDDGPFANFLSFPSLKDWQGFYKKHHEVNSFFSEFTSFFLPSKSIEFSVLDEFRLSGWNNNHDNPEALTKAFGGISDELYRLLYETNNPSFTSENFSENEQQKVGDFLANPKMNFFVNVYLLFNAFYAEEPGVLLRKARLGDYGALEKILRLDKMMISEPGIAAQVYKLKSEGKKVQYHKLLNCLGRKPKFKLTIQKIKYVKAGQISALAELLGVKLTAPDIRALYNAISKDSGRGMEDSDLYDIEDEAFRKAVQRERKFWIERYSRDK